MVNGNGVPGTMTATIWTGVDVGRDVGMVASSSFSSPLAYKSLLKRTLHTMKKVLLLELCEQ